MGAIRLPGPPDVAQAGDPHKKRPREGERLVLLPPDFKPKAVQREPAEQADPAERPKNNPANEHDQRNTPQGMPEVTEQAE
jgi:hypothetical protein